jgi:class 3 adenylate cyclase
MDPDGTRAARQNQPSGEELSEIHALFADHSVEELRKAYSWDRLTRMVRSESLTIVVMAADIRESTALLERAGTLQVFATAVREMIDAADSVIRREDGFFDKFLGDGFLAYWAPSDYGQEMLEEEEDRAARHLRDAVTLGVIMNDVLASGVMDLSHGIEGIGPMGFSVGIEVGEAAFFKVAGRWTIMGMPVVRASRMAGAKENVGNTYLGEAANQLLTNGRPGAELPPGWRTERSPVSTKDPGGTLEAYRVVTI